MCVSVSVYLRVFKFKCVIKLSIYIKDGWAIILSPLEYPVEYEKIGFPPWSVPPAFEKTGFPPTLAQKPKSLPPPDAWGGGRRYVTLDMHHKISVKCPKNYFIYESIIYTHIYSGKYSIKMLFFLTLMWQMQFETCNF